MIFCLECVLKSDAELRVILSMQEKLSKQGELLHQYTLQTEDLNAKLEVYIDYVNYC